MFSNTILVSQTVGIYVENGSSAQMDGTLWGSAAWANGQDWAGGGTILTGTVNVWGDPGFIDPENGDYHIAPTSAAVDAGVDAGVYTDIDGEPRPIGPGFDIGTDEVGQGPRYVATSGVDVGDCTDLANPCRTVQYAVDVAEPSDEVRVAGGLYNESRCYYRDDQPPGWIYINESGRTPTGRVPTTLDPQGSGNVIFITGGVTPTVSGLRITHGQPHGIEISNASPIIQDNLISDNSASGVFLGSWPTGTASVWIEGNLIQDNGQGIEVYFSSAAAYSNTFENNGPASEGGGLFALSSQVEVIGNQFTGNQAGSTGGGIYARESEHKHHPQYVRLEQRRNNGRGDLSYSGQCLIERQHISQVMHRMTVRLFIFI